MGSPKNEPYHGPPGGLERSEWRQLASLELKLADGEKLTYDENRIYLRLSKKRNEGLFETQAEEVPKRYWNRWSGRDNCNLNAQSDRYGIPVGGATISLPAVAKWLHDWIAENGRRFNAMDEEANPGESSEALEEYRRAGAELRWLELATRKKELIDRNVVHDGMMEVASMLRKFGDLLQRQYGFDATRAFNEHLTEARQRIEAMLDGMSVSDDGGGDQS